MEKNTKLVNLDCYRNKLSSLDLTKNTNLRCVNCSGNNLKTLDVSQCKYICELLRRKQPGVSEKLGGYGWWDFTADGNGDCLFLDQIVKVITDKEEKGKTKGQQEHREKSPPNCGAWRDSSKCWAMQDRG